MRGSRTFASLLLGAAVLAAPLSLRAQDHAAPEHAAEPHKAEGHEAKGEAHGQVHAEGHEAKGEGHGEGHGGGHHAPEIKLLGIPLGGGVQFGLKVLNFAIFGAIIAFAVKGKASAAFKEKAEELQAALNKAEKDKAEGEAQMRELEAKMAGLQGELDTILSKADSDAQAEKVRIIEAARAEAAAILAQAQTEIGHQQRMAEQELRALVTQLAVEGATTRLQQAMQTGAASQVLDRAIQQVGGVK